MRDHHQRIYKPKADEIQSTARAVVRVLTEHGFHSCLFGSTAAAMYGAENRNPRDVDLIVLLPASSSAAAEITVEEIKHLIADNSSSDFYLLPSKDPRASHKILYYILTPEYPFPFLNGSERINEHHHACKVDLLLPGLIGIPETIPSEVIHYEDYFPDIPLLPFAVLLLLKVRAWAEHRTDARFSGPPSRWVKEKLRFDEEDITELLDLAVNEYTIKMKSVEMWAGWEWVEGMKDYVRKYVESFPNTKAMWQEIGLSLKSEWSLPPPLPPSTRRRGF